MTAELRTSADKLRLRSPELNKAAERANIVVQLVESFLNDECRAGVPCYVTVWSKQQNSHGDADDFEGLFLGYDRVGGKFRIVIQSNTKEWNDETERDEVVKSTTPWSDAPRAEKLETFESVPALVQALADKIERSIQKVDETAKTVNGILDALKRIPNVTVDAPRDPSPNLIVNDPRVRDFHRRMVTIAADVVPLKGERITGNGSGFVVGFKGRTWLITAGHVADALKTAHDAGRLLRLFLCDAWSGADGRGLPVVLPCGYAHKFTVFGDETSYDVAMLDLGINLAAQLEQGQIITVPENEWRKPPANFDFYLLLGTPGETFDTNEIAKRGPNGEDVRQLASGFDIRRGVFEIEKIERPHNAAATAHERFYGKLVPIAGGVKVKDIGGVSGGVVFGCKRKGNDYSLHVLAVQSAWIPDKKIIIADYLSSLPTHFEAAGLQ